MYPMLLPNRTPLLPLRLLFCCLLSCGSLALQARSADTIPALDIVINEIVASNDSISGVGDLTGDYDDWIELYNTTGSAIDLSNVFLSDKADNLQKWQFPAGSTLPAFGYVIVWADEDGGDPGLHANFKLSKEGEALYLTNADGSFIDSLNFGPQETNVALARVPNGTGPFIMQHMTWKFSNDTPVATAGVRPALEARAYPNPATEMLRVSIEDSPEGPYFLEVYAAAGPQLMMAQRVRANEATIAVGALPAGLYLLKIRSRQGQTTTVRFVKR